MPFSEHTDLTSEFSIDILDLINHSDKNLSPHLAVETYAVSEKGQGSVDSKIWGLEINFSE